MTNLSSLWVEDDVTITESLMFLYTFESLSCFPASITQSLRSHTTTHDPLPAFLITTVRSSANERTALHSSLKRFEQPNGFSQVLKISCSIWLKNTSRLGWPLGGFQEDFGEYAFSYGNPQNQFSVLAHLFCFGSVQNPNLSLTHEFLYQSKTFCSS